MKHGSVPHGHTEHAARALMLHHRARVCLRWHERLPHGRREIPQGGRAMALDADRGRNCWRGFALGWRRVRNQQNYEGGTSPARQLRTPEFRPSPRVRYESTPQSVRIITQPGRALIVGRRRSSRERAAPRAMFFPSPGFKPKPGALCRRRFQPTENQGLASMPVPEIIGTLSRQPKSGGFAVLTGRVMRRPLSAPREPIAVD